MSEHPVHNAFDYETRHAERDYDAYLESRPYQDANGAVHDPQTGKFIDPNKHFDQRRSELEKAGQAEPYENLSVPELARKMAAADFKDDDTTADSIYEVLNDKLDILDDRYFSDRDKSSTRSTRNPDSGRNHNELRSEKLWDRVMKIHDRELERLKEKEEKQPTEPDGGNGSEDDDADKDRRPYKNSDGDFIANAADTVTYDEPEGPAEPEDTGEDITEEMPSELAPEPSSESGEEETDVLQGKDQSQPEGRWAQFKRGVWKHLYEAPIDMTPMGPPIEPDIPFDQWYAENRQNESRRQRRILAAAGALAATSAIALVLANNTNKDTSGTLVYPHQNTPAKKGMARLPGAPELKAAIRLQDGSNPWVLSEQQLRANGNSHPTAAEIEDYDKRMARLNPEVYSYYGDSSKHIPAGTELKLPRP